MGFGVTGNTSVFGTEESGFEPLRPNNFFKMKIKTSTRIVLLTKKRAYKLPIDFRGYLQGKNEGIFWKLYSKTNMLAPLHWERFGIVCQERVDSVVYVKPSLVSKIKELIPQFNFENCDLRNPENWGMYNGKYVLLDYGIDERISKMY